MRVYEATYILDPGLEEENVTQAQEKFADHVIKSGGEIVNVETWGKRKLAYEVKGFNEGIYVIMRFNSQEESANVVRRQLKLSDEVIKSLIIRLN